MFIFEDKPIYLNAKQFVVFVYSIVKTFPNDEKFGLKDQIRRAVVSVLLNISEGFIRGTKKEFIHFLWIAQESLSEVVSGFDIAKDLKYITKDQWDQIYIEAEKLAKHINRIIYSKP